MASIRTEQEKRCALDKPYLGDMSEMTDIVKNNDTKNFTITLAARGIDAASKGKYSYTLKIPSYADGRICCDGTECSKLNKNYPTCEELKGKPDYQESPAECAGETSEETETEFTCSGDAEEQCGCNNGGIRTRTCDTSTGQWSAWGDCSIADTCECPASTKPNKSTSCNGCGTKTRTVTCDTETGEWKTGSWGTCSKTSSQCNPGPGPGPDPEPENCCSCQSSSKDGEADCGEWMSSCIQNDNFGSCRYQCGACEDWVISCGAWYSESSQKICCTCSTGCGSDCGSCGSCGSDGDIGPRMTCSSLNGGAGAICENGVAPHTYVDANCNAIDCECEWDGTQMIKKGEWGVLCDITVDCWQRPTYFCTNTLPGQI